jgi:L-iditol 2-dehydrogenase
VKAQVFHGPGDLRLEELPAPAPAAGEVVLRVEAALTCGTDVKTLHRGHPVMIPRVPTAFGHELAGVVTAVGRGVREFREGDRAVAANSAPCRACRFCAVGRENLCLDLLFVNGAYAESIALPARLVRENLVLLPARLASSRAAFVEPLACALHGIEQGGVAAGMTVAVFGPGPLGCLLALVARARGARVLLIGHPGWRLERVAALGIAQCLDTGERRPGVVDAIRSLTDGRGADVTVDATGRPDGWEHSVAAVARGGTVVLFGGCAPGTTMALDTRRAHYEELCLVGAFHHRPDLIRQAVDLLGRGDVVPDGLITHAMGLDAVPEALALMASGRALKVLITPGGAPAPRDLAEEVSGHRE